MATADSLFDLHRVPRKVIVYDGVAKLQIQTFGTGVRTNKDLRIISKIVYDGVLIFHATTVVCFAEILDLPCSVYFFCHGIIEVPIEE